MSEESKITAKRVGGIWHGYLEGHPEVDERGLTESIAKRKAGEIAHHSYGMTCGATTRMFGGKACEKPPEHDAGEEIREHRQGSVTWAAVPESRV